MGTAFRTPIPPTVFTTPADSTAVFAVYPPVPYGESETAHLLVTSSNLARDSMVYPCDRAGQLLDWKAIAVVAVRNHAAALRAAGYELELVMPRGA